jgi:hypothetical protein
VRPEYLRGTDPVISVAPVTIRGQQRQISATPLGLWGLCLTANLTAIPPQDPSAAALASRNVAPQALDGRW